jgi:hypothetical protein
MSLDRVGEQPPVVGINQKPGVPESGAFEKQQVTDENGEAADDCQGSRAARTMTIADIEDDHALAHCHR